MGSEANWRSNRSADANQPRYRPKPFQRQGVPLIITQIQHTDEQVTLSWTSSPGASYQLEEADDLSTNSWDKIGAVVTATGTVSSQTETVVPRFRHFYRCKHVLFD